MFGTGHPRPLHRKEVPMHVLRQEQRRLDSHTLTVDMPDEPDAAAPPAAQAIRFDVVYTLSEYLGFLRDHLSFPLRHAQKPMRMRRIGLVMYERGAMPIPFRCMDRAQEAAFRRLAAKVHEA